MAAPASRTAVQLPALLPVLVGAETVVIASDLGDAVRYGLGGLVLVALVTVLYRLGRTRRVKGAGGAASPTV
ncbi:hypothetical protein [Streptosporangium sp. 'caverna']|uniref:hypothetical protein n=1 Tax=Streptosporangium sp. 'caverna' TaxID=2202249 RepID=UPI000D7D5337|nr:hypothetical protein [Streptosporangium sp. 'caverna']AWS40425.1 hypothetical protein DKM19_02820 [Streptosporangium sp. 'caverna']